MKENKEAFLIVRVTQTTKKELERQSKASGKKLSELLREIVDAFLGND